MRIFETNVQKLKYEVIKALIKNEYEKNLNNIYLDIPKMISPGPKANLRCCIYKERVILQERITLALGGDKNNNNIIEPVEIACDECPVSGVFVTPSCRGCITHKCIDSCPKKAISIIDKKAIIDKEKCIECERCIRVCPYKAIIQQKRPCIIECPVNAITVENTTKKVLINNEKCIMCGACIYHCPFGALSDKSFILDLIKILKNSNNNANYKTYAVIAPSIVSQFKYAKTEQLITGLLKIGFYDVIEAATGADVTLHKDYEEWKKHKILLSSCCPSFVMYVEKNFPLLIPFISTASSPMVEAGRLIKKKDPTAKTIFIGPCSSKKAEFQYKKTENAIDCAISFEELQAFFDALDIEIQKLEETKIDLASYYGRIFAKSGGVSAGVSHLAENEGIQLNPVAMNGILACKEHLTKLNNVIKNSNNDTDSIFEQLEYNFYEGMACEGGCLNGALCINRNLRNVVDINKYGLASKDKEVTNDMIRDIYPK